MKLSRLLVLGGAVLFLAGALLFAYLGIFNRYWADDYCYNADFKRLGLLGTLQGYSYITTYASNRFSLTLLSGLLYRAGILGVQAMTPGVILIWLGGLFWLLHNVRKGLALQVGALPVLLAAAMPVYFSLYTAPHQYQSFYWRSGLLPYTAPLALTVLILALITAQDGRERPSPALMLLAGGLAFLAGGFSEAGCAMLTAVLGLYLVAAYVFREKAWARRTWATAGVALAAALLAMALLIASPTSELRMARYGDPTPLARLPFLTAYLALQFVRLSLLDQPLPHLALLLSAGALAYLIDPFAGRELRPQAALGWGIAALAAAFLLIAAALSPSAFIEGTIPALRTRILPRFVMLAALALLGILAGGTLRRVSASRWLPGLVMAGLLLGYLYSARTIAVTAQKVSLYAHRAAVWDARDAQIRRAAAQGLPQVVVEALDSAPVGGINDLQARDTHWINNCAESFYGIASIEAK